MSEPETTPAAPARRPLSPLEQGVCAWPILLVFVGGALGGACGGAAWALNTRIMSSGLSAPVRYALVIASGLGAGLLYFIGVIVLTMLFPNVFGAR